MLHPDDMPKFDVSRLADLRDQALVKSKFFNITCKIGKLTIGPAVAEWEPETEDFTTARLVQTGPDYNGRPLLGRYTTKLLLETVYDSLRDTEGRALELIAHRKTFKMSLGDEPKIAVFSNLMPAAVKYGLDMNRSDLHKENRHGLHTPTEFDLELLFKELERGASGAYSQLQQEREEP